jgi:hypothetical protein
MLDFGSGVLDERTAGDVLFPRISYVSMQQTNIHEERVQLEQHHLLVSTKIVFESSNLVVNSISCRKCICKKN